MTASLAERHDADPEALADAETTVGTPLRSGDAAAARPALAAGLPGTVVPDAGLGGAQATDPASESPVAEEVAAVVTDDPADAWVGPTPRAAAAGPAEPAPALRIAMTDSATSAAPAAPSPARIVPDAAAIRLDQNDGRPVIAHPPLVLRQIADAVVTMKGDRLEIALSPEELGRLRLIVTGAERAAQVTVWVERPEVLDLLRRNAGLLSEHFAEAGLEGAGFEFREEPRDDGSTDRSPIRPDAADVPGGRATPDITHLVSLAARHLPGDRRLDIRL